LRKQYELKFGGKVIGKVEAVREGLYYRFYCRCTLSGDVICRAMLEHDGKRENLGILVPEGDGFASRAKIPAKQLGDEEWRFLVVPNRGEESGKYIPIKPEEPFAYIARLKEAYLRVHQGNVCAVLEEDM
jgi:hypothetical protein